MRNVFSVRARDEDEDDRRDNERVVRSGQRCCGFTGVLFFCFLDYADMACIYADVTSVRKVKMLLLP